MNININININGQSVLFVLRADFPIKTSALNGPCAELFARICMCISSGTCGNNTYHLFQHSEHPVLSQYGIPIIPTKNSDFSHKQHTAIVLCNGEACFFCEVEMYFLWQLHKIVVR